MGGVTKSAHSVSACGENCARSLCSAFPHATRFAGLARRPQSVLPKRLRPQARVVGQPPHERRHLGRRQTGRARSKRKERLAPNLRVRASWLKYGGCSESFPIKSGQSPTATRRTLDNRNTPCPRVGVRWKPPGKSRIPCLPLSAGAALAVDAGRRGRRPLQGGACRGGCPHPPVSSPHPPPSKAQANLEGQSFR